MQVAPERVTGRRSLSRSREAAFSAEMATAASSSIGSGRSTTVMATAVVKSITKYRCAYPGCKKRYASTDGVRKHARKAHRSWIDSIDALLEGTCYNEGYTRNLVMGNLSRPSTYSRVVESGDGMEQEPEDEPRVPLTTTVRRLNSTGDVLLEQVLDAGNFKFDSPSNHWPWAADVAAEEAFDGSDGGLSRETLEASDSQVSYVPSPSSNHLCTLICWFSWQYSCVSRMSSINEVLPHQSPAVQPQPLGTQARALCWYAAMPPCRRLAADSPCFACRCRLSATSSSPMYCKVFGGTSGSSAGSKD